MCKHENAYLVGTANGIICRKCGANFKSFAEIHTSKAPEAKPKTDDAEKNAAPAKRGRKRKTE